MASLEQSPAPEILRDEAPWLRCPECRELIWRRQWLTLLRVCPVCGYAFRLSMRERIRQLVDEGSFEESDADLSGGDPLGFRDRQPYVDRLSAARRATGGQEAAAFGFARLGGKPVVLAVLDFEFMGGSMGLVVGEKVARAAELACRERLPLITVSASGGARMQEGALALLQMAKTADAIGALADERLLFISVLTDPTMGGVAASFAFLGDLILAEAGALVGFAGPRVIEQTVKQQLPPGFQRAEFLLTHGMVDVVLPRAQLRQTLCTLLVLHEAERPSQVHALPAPRPRSDARGGAPPDGWTAVLLARHPRRPRADELIAGIADEFLPLHGDRLGSDDAAVIGGVGRMGRRSVMLIATAKGRTASENLRRNFGMAHPEGYRKIERLARHAAKFGLPVVCLVDTPGASPGIEDETRGQAQAIAQALATMIRLRTPVISVIVGEGGSGGALVLAAGDRLLMLEHAVYSVISPEGCAAILWRDQAAVETAANMLRLRASDLLQLGIADEVLPEPDGGAHADGGQTIRIIRQAIEHHLADLADVPPDDLLEQRTRRLRQLGVEYLSECVDEPLLQFAGAR